PDSAPQRMWEDFVAQARLVSPSNRRHLTVVVVGTGLAGAGAAAALAEMGFRVQVVTAHDTPRRAHSVAAQGGINAARARRVDGDHLARFVRDTVKGGDFRARESEAWRLGEESARVIDHMNALGVPFAREYGGSLSTRSFGGVQVSRTYYSRGQTGQQLQVAASSALMRQVAAGHASLWVRHEVWDLVLRDGRAAGVVLRDLTTGALRVLPAHAVVMATGGYGNLYFHSTLAKNSNATAIWRAHRAGAAFASPSFIQFHPTALPVSTPWQSKTTLMSESLRNDGRIWVPLQPGDDRPPSQIPEDQRDYYLERKYPAFGNLTPRDIASRAARAEIDSGHGVGPLHNSVYLDFRDALTRLGRDTIAERYGNLFEMYRDSTGEDPYTRPMRIAPGAHFTMGGLWVDYRLMSTIPGLFVAGEANAAYHGANRLGANSLLAACVDGAFTIPRTVPDYLAGLLGHDLVEQDDPAVVTALERVRTRARALTDIGGSTPAKVFHRRLGEIMYRDCGVVRERAGLERGIAAVAQLRADFHRDLRVSGGTEEYNQDLVEAARVEDYLELAELMCVDAWHREESCGAHFRAEHQTQGEALRDDEHWMLTSAWTSSGWGGGPGGAAPEPRLTHHAEFLTFRSVDIATRSYA
ncbi:MAG: fumarate reductase/succinate dehydrogenase flavoprotein subunit, partial [Propionibacterium sp.]|nr:fumarate reductase/succinate dehydrogenase flavoprotein subunit [Propionibacterium sp.]